VIPGDLLFRAETADFARSDEEGREYTLLRIRTLRE